MNDPVFDLVMALHVLVAIVGFGSLAATGVGAAAARRSPDPWASERLRRYFAVGRNGGSLLIVAVPLLGGTLLWLGHGVDARHAWPWIGLGIWSVAAGVASAVVWPGERRIQRLLAPASAAAAVDVAAIETLRSLCRRVERAVAVTSVCFAIAVVVMIAQPG